MAEPFRVAMTRDVIRPDGSLGFGGVGVTLMQNAPGVEMVFFDKHPGAFTPEDLAGFDALAMLGGRITAASLKGNERLALIARFGVGYDNVDVDAATEAGVFLTITPEAVRRPMAVVNLTYLLTLARRCVSWEMRPKPMVPRVRPVRPTPRASCLSAQRPSLVSAFCSKMRLASVSR